MTARRIARELAVIIMPQLPREKKKLEKLEFDALLCRSVQILTEHARQCLSDANSYLSQVSRDLYELELAHPDNARKISDIKPVTVKSDELRQQLEKLEISMHLISEALDIPEMAISSDLLPETVKCGKCGEQHKIHVKRPCASEVKLFVEELISTYFDHRSEIDRIIGAVKTKWRIERMVSIDRDILRLSCTEAFFMPDIPVKVAISEAVELAHRFADDKAAKFINGVMAGLSSDAEEYRKTGELKIAPLSEDELRALSKQ